MNGETALERLCAWCGIAPDYYDIWGQRRHVSPGTQRALLAAMGIAAGTETEARHALGKLQTREWGRLLPPVTVKQRDGGAVEIPVTVPAAARQRRFDWLLTFENGGCESGTLCPAELAMTAEAEADGVAYVRCTFALPHAPDIGYHRFEMRSTGEGQEHAAHMSLIMVPLQCYRPAALAEHERIWGPAAQIYALRSQRNWGAGDFTDLKTLIDLAARIGAGIIGVNPVHALFPHNPAHASPYSPSSRLFLNVFYLDVEAIPDFAECDAARGRVSAPEFQVRLRALRATEWVEYREVADIKLGVLEQLYVHFRERHLEAGDQRAHAFRGFQAEGGTALRRQALFEALQRHFHGDDPSIWGWPAWPEPYHDPAAEAVTRFAVEQTGQVEFFEYLQWQAELQLEAASQCSWEHAFGVGLYQDLALGVDRGCAEAWANQGLYALGASMGAPPDDFNLHGQDWGLPPMIPAQLVDAAYAPFIATLRANMRHAGALRIDHVMGLMRLFWIPAGGTPEEGAYVAYPLDDLFGIVALESQRNRCLVIGEDLGTVPDAVREAMARYGAMMYRVLYFEKMQDGGFSPPAAYPAPALVTVSTHDLPTLGGYWQGSDLGARSRLGLFPSEEMREQQISTRARDRAQLLAALEREQLLPATAGVDSAGHMEMSAELARAIHVYLARTPSQVMMVRPEDIQEQVEQVNMPGTTDQYPNWKRKLPLDLEAWLADPRLVALAAALRAERGSAAPPAV